MTKTSLEERKVEALESIARGLSALGVAMALTGLAIVLCLVAPYLP